jgi:hypothetical protein
MKIITDKDKIKESFEETYHHHPTFLFYNKKQYPVKVISISHDEIIIKTIPLPETEVTPRILTSVDNKSLYIFTFEFLGAKGQYEVIRPSSLEIVPAYSLVNKKNPERLYVTNIINQSDLVKTLVANNDITNEFIKDVTKKLDNKISRLEVFIHERVDVRLKLLQEYDKVIYIPDKSNPSSVPSEFLPYDIYYRRVKYSKGIDKLISEITVPLKFRNKFTFGYVSLLNDAPMDASYLEIANSIATNWKKHIFSQNILHESQEGNIILDINSKEFSFFHENFNNFGKIFNIGATIIFEICFSAEEKFLCRGIVKGIIPTEKHFKITCEFSFYSDEESKTTLDFIKLHCPKLHIVEENEEYPW